MKRTISALLLIAMLASVSCGSAGTGNDITSDDTTVSESTETSAETNDRENVKDNLPETDFGGDKFTMLVRAPSARMSSRLRRRMATCSMTRCINGISRLRTGSI